jgi:pimeloyl-ACP methyl ester carboxylesterase
VSERLKAAAARAGLSWPATDGPEAWAELAVDVFLRPPPPSRMPPREQSYLASAVRGTVGTRHGKLAQWTWGHADAPTVLLVHGWAGRAAQLGAFAAPLVAAGFRVVAFDGPAHGESGGREAHVPMLAECIADIAGQSGALRAIIGHSMGAASAAMATYIGTVPRGLVLIAPPLSHRGRAERVAARLELTPEVRAAFFLAAERRTGWKDEVCDMRVVARRGPCPALVLHDPEDDSTDYAGSVEFTALWAGARLVPCPGRGHIRILATADVVAEAVRFVGALP